MSTNTNKKIFVVNGISYTLVMGKRWYVEYQTYPVPQVAERHRPTGGINRIKDLKAREAAALAFIERLAASGTTQPVTSVLEKQLNAMRPHLRPKTYSTYRSKVRGWIQWLKGGSDALATAEQARAYIAWLASNRSKTTTKSYQQTLNELYGLIGGINPFAGIKTAARQSKSKKPFNDRQANALLALAAERGNETLQIGRDLLYYCFIRPSESRFLIIDEDVDLEAGYIEVRAEISKNKKTQNVIIPDAFKPQLAAYIGRRHGLLLYHPTLFGPISRDYLYKEHKKLENELELGKRYSIYSWKHTGVVKAVKAGINLKFLQMQLRHHSLDQLDEYLRDLGLHDSGDLSKRFPGIAPAVRAEILCSLTDPAGLTQYPAPFCATLHTADISPQRYTSRS